MLHLQHNLPMTQFRIRAAARVLLLSVLAVSVLGACSTKLTPAATIDKARELMQAGKPGEARIALKNLVDAHPKTVEAYAMLAQIELDSGSPQTANLELTKIPADGFKDAESQTVRIRTLLALGKPADALAALDANADRLIPVSQRAALRAQALRALGRSAEALEGLRTALAADPKNPQLIMETANTLAALGNIAPALRELDAALAAPAQPDADLLRARGELRLRSGAADKAIEDLQAALKAAPKSWPILSRYNTELALGDAQLAAGHIDAAKAQTATLKKIAPKAYTLALLVGRVAMAEGRFGDAVDSLQQVSEQLPDNAPVQYLLVEALLRSGNMVRASAELEKRIQKAPDDLRARQALAQISMQQNRPDKVVELLGDPALASLRGEAGVGGLLAGAREAQQRAGKAISELTAQLAKSPADPDVRTQLAEAYLQSGDPNRALYVLQQPEPALTTAAAIGVGFAARLAQGNDREINSRVQALLDADHVSLDGLLAASDAAQRAGRADLARSLIDRVLQRDARNGAALLRRANVEFSGQHYAEARKALESLLAMHPEDSRAHIAMARVVEAQGDVAAARSQLQAVIKATPGSLQATMMLAGLELRAGNLAAASSALDSAINTNPADGKVANAAGLLLLATKHGEEARTRFRQAVDQQPQSAEFWFNLGRSQLAANDNEAARESFANSVARRPDSLEANLAAVGLNAKLGHTAEARRLADALVARLPGNPAAWALVGDVARLEKRFEDARNAYSKSYALQANGVTAMSEFTVRVAGKLPAPDQPLLTWLAHAPRDLAVRRRLAEYYMTSGDAKAGITQLELVLKQAPNDLTSLNNLAWLLLSSDSKRAEALARKAMAIDPQSPAVADTLGAALLEQKRFPEAQRVLQRAAQGMPKDPSVQYRYALALARSGDKDAARRVLAPVVVAGAAFPESERAKALAQELGQ